MNSHFLGQWFESSVKWLNDNMSWLFDSISWFINGFTKLIESGLKSMPFIWILALFVVIPLTKNKPKMAVLFVVNILVIRYLNLYNEALATSSIVIVSSFISLVVGVPLGIWAAKKPRVNTIIRPILDFMQTMPAFVYLIPAVIFFGLGSVPAVFATIIYAMPPVVRLTTHGINEVPNDLIEAGESFGATSKQMLYKIQLPYAMQTIFTGINQTLMLSLSMVVISAMIGAKGLGSIVYKSITTVDIAVGFESGLAVVLLAIIFDRVTAMLSKDTKKTKLSQNSKMVLKIMGAISLIWVVVIPFLGNSDANKKEIKFSVVSWDDVNATTALAQNLIEKYTDNTTSTVQTDVGIAYQSIASNDLDVFTGGWNPITHEQYLKKFKKDLNVLKPMYTEAKLGLVVPKYVKANSIDDLKDSKTFKKKIYGIDPGSGIMKSAKKAIEDYDLDYDLVSSSTQSMISQLDKDIVKEKPIAITGWKPHWMFSRYKLKFLEDKKKSFGKKDNISIVVSKQFKSKFPKAYKIISNIKFDSKSLEELLNDVSNQKDIKKGVSKWISENKDIVNKWVKDIKK